ncbi:MULTISPECIES: sigma-70 family RNA polymerase sigma factor [Streptomyces]|uniref:Sigma-70 family RNA polymerase sigma factor n=2 Tax=Streptomyces rimosus subsp. rimosus TaxID=132474 RepID=L8EG52_STRR1|nr:MULTISPECIES: sigma-70 family RNA polymerase sigma factor [Streptomyces]KOG72688.1 RNA polymerase sigma 70 [Kitasatospora aureofaciens]MYT48525.1 sigma-70 family RNA polymerase sigma factor [Streptomyces sp. SID5471]KEF07077.1 RNA polymerase sigma 70 [Streptomyces rimosus]KEF22047.1 RNA polymerase sigma 70 [Streptomyces rimosus]KUJ30121.1 RNA polymerase subunit sigma-70 [Streptomyces rimosus subsp. rimosus]
MDENDFLAERFEEHRAHLRAVAYRMLGSLSEADDAVQESWLRLSRSDVSGVGNLGGWLTTVVGRVCLDMLRSRTARGEESLDVRVPDPVVGGGADGIDPEHQALLADSVGLALLVVLQTLAPAERLAFVLHDMFAVAFEEIGPVVGRTPAAARQLASRARRRVRGTATPDTDLARQREVVDAFMAASRGGDFEALVAVLDPDVVLRADTGAGFPGLAATARGAREVAGRAFMFRRFAHFARPALVNGAMGIVTVADRGPVSVMGLTIAGGKIVAIDILADPERLRGLGLGLEVEREGRG